jgi:type IV pilus assembly protein PilV
MNMGSTAPGLGAPHKGEGRERSRSQGFTLIEVMVAVGLMTVGALSIMAMQQAATRGNLEARQIGSAAEVTNRWIERLRRDALMWTAQGTASQSTYLAALGTSGTTGFLRPDPDNGAADASTPKDATFISPGFDYYGLPTLVPAEMTYCSFVRLTWVRTGATMRADVLTWWPRRGAADDTSKRTFNDCGRGAVNEVLAEIARTGSSLRSMRASILLRWTQRRAGVAAP